MFLVSVNSVFSVPSLVYLSLFSNTSFGSVTPATLNYHKRLRHRPPNPFLPFSLLTQTLTTYRLLLRLTQTSPSLTCAPPPPKILVVTAGPGPRRHLYRNPSFHHHETTTTHTLPSSLRSSYFRPRTEPDGFPTPPFTVSTQMFLTVTQFQGLR